MQNNDKKYFIQVDGNPIEVSEEVYRAFYIRSTTDFYTALECAGFERKRSKSARLLFGLQLKSDFLD